MIDINLIRNQTETVQKALAKKGYQVSFSSFLQKDAMLKETKNQTDALKAERNRVSKSIPELKKQNKPTEPVFEQMRTLGIQIEQADAIIKALEEELFEFLTGLPNMPDNDLVAGEKEANEVIYTFGTKPEFEFTPKNHVELCESLHLIDYKRGAKLAGNGNWIYTGMGARLEWAILNYFIDEHLKDGYQFMLIPHMLNYACGFGAGQFPKFKEDVYWIKGDGEEEKFLLPTAETGLVNLHAGEVLEVEELPKKYFGYTPCYRKEAGSYRAEERGMIRGHQFNKIEMVQYTLPEQSSQAFDELVEKAKRLVEQLGLHYHVSKLAAGDISASMARTYDVEVWIPSMNIYKEVSSVSNARDYQARRSNTKYRNAETKKLEYVHTLNGSGLATSRIIPAIVEQFQQADGSVKVPQVLVKYLGVTELKPE